MRTRPPWATGRATPVSVAFWTGIEDVLEDSWDADSVEVPHFFNDQDRAEQTMPANDTERGRGATSGIGILVDGQIWTHSRLSWHLIL